MKEYTRLVIQVLLNELIEKLRLSEIEVVGVNKEYAKGYNCAITQTIKYLKEQIDLIGNQ